MVVGLGRIGLTYDVRLDAGTHVMTHSRALRMHPSFDLCGAVDPSPDARSLFEQVYGRRAFADLHAACRALAPDVVVIATPTRDHASTCASILDHAQPRGILCEKPLAYDLTEAAHIVSRCKAARCLLAVNYMRRADPGAIEVRRRIETGAIATPVKGVAWYTKGLLHNGSHLVNLLEFWLGPVASCEVIQPGRRAGDDVEPDVRVEFTAGAVTFLAAQEEHFSHYTIELVAPNGRLRYDAGGFAITWQPAVPDPEMDGYVTLSAAPETIPNGMPKWQWHVVDEWARQLGGASAALCSGAEALRTLETLTALQYA
jgi:predicted dehydrogenase